MVSKVKEKKERLDVLLVKRGLMPSREKAKAVIMAGEVFVDNQREDKAGQTFPESVQIEVRGKKMKYVSRGGYKLEQAMNVFPISLTDTVCMDVGSSTGGFTDCMLQNGAKYVYAIDVGTNHASWFVPTVVSAMSICSAISRTFFFSTTCNKRTSRCFSGKDSRIYFNRSWMSSSISGSSTLENSMASMILS